MAAQFNFSLSRLLDVVGRFNQFSSLILFSFVCKLHESCQRSRVSILIQTLDLVRGTTSASGKVSIHVHKLYILFPARIEMNFVTTIT